MMTHAGIQPQIIEYLTHPPSREALQRLIASSGLSVRGALREKDTPYAELGLADPTLSDDALLDAMLTYPILINRPFVVTPMGVRLCRPSERVLDILPPSQPGVLSKEDGEHIIDADPRSVF